jgi:hypothetical protein
MVVMARIFLLAPLSPLHGDTMVAVNITLLLLVEIITFRLHLFRLATVTIATVTMTILMSARTPLIAIKPDTSKLLTIF